MTHPGGVREPDLFVPAGCVSRGRVRVPPSKSHALRCLVAAMLADGESTLSNLGGSDDVAAAVRALSWIGMRVEDLGGGTIRVLGRDRNLDPVDLNADVGGSGTMLRFLCAVAALRPGSLTITGDESLHGRPVGSVAKALRALGAKVQATEGRPPVVVSGGPVRGGGELNVDGSRSSHPVSATLLIAPMLRDGLRVVLPTAPVSRPYIDLTVSVMRTFGAHVVESPPTGGSGEEERQDWFEVREQGYRGTDVEIEGDWSSGAYLLGLGPASRGQMCVAGLKADSVQADRRVVDLLTRFGAYVEVTSETVTATGQICSPVVVDLGACPDLAPLVGALACLAPGRSVVHGAAHLRSKESDRIAAVVAAARALGCRAQETDDGFVVHGGSPRPGIVDPRGDHRIALAFGVAGVALPGTRIRNPSCVAKSYPGFWRALHVSLGL